MAPGMLWSHFPAWARTFKLCFLNFGGVAAAPPLSAAGGSLAIRPFPPSTPPSRCSGVMSLEGSGTRLVAEVIKGECGGEGASRSRHPDGIRLAGDGGSPGFWPGGAFNFPAGANAVSWAWVAFPDS